MRIFRYALLDFHCNNYLDNCFIKLFNMKSEIVLRNFPKMEYFLRRKGQSAKHLCKINVHIYLGIMENLTNELKF